jgi:uncharacterized protein
MITDPLFYAAAIPAVILVGLSKGGFAGIGALSLPLLALVISPIQGAAIMLPILMVQDVISMQAYWKQWDRTNLAHMVPGAVVGILAAWLLAAWISEAIFELVLGLISVGFGLRHLFEAGDVPPRPTNALAGFFWGGVSGFTSMVANTGGPPFQIHVTPQKLARDTFIGTMVLFFFIINWLKVVPFIALGQFTGRNLWTSLVLVPVAVLSTWAGIWLVRRVSGESFYRIIYALMLLVGGKLIWDGTRLLLG